MSAAEGEIRRKLQGAWRYIGTRLNGQNWDRGANPKGMIYYGPHGEMSVQIAPDVLRTRAGAVMTPDEAFLALKDYIAYFGTYSIDESAGTVTHHRQATIQPGDAGDFVRRIEFIGDRLVLRPPNSTLEVTWERIK
ncbi:MAG: lipocalin-like domain-containing protein [Pseudolabrys sp.]|nr:lipocalin-like domain-containing protein [Pseudolabrys sp.]